MSENKTGKYLKYALGEILLVMIGILLALQVNNWNTKRLEKIEERNYLHRLVNDLRNDLKEVEIVVADNQKRLNRCKATLDSLEVHSIPYNRMNLKEWNDSLKIDTTTLLNRSFGNGLTRIRFYLEFNQNNNTFQELLASGKIDIIADEELKLAILNYYSFTNNSFQLVRKISMMRDKFVESLARLGISMYNDMNYSQFDKLVINKENLIAEIENIFYITRTNQFALKFGGNSIEKKTRDLISMIENKMVSYTPHKK